MDYDYTKGNILITNSSLSGFTGTETWVYAMAEELKNVTVLTNMLGKMSDRLKCKVITKYEGEYDFAIVNHSTMYSQLPKDLFKIFTSHSLVFGIEQFPEESKCNVGISEAICDKVIRNGINCEKFKPTKVNKELKNILYLSNPNYSGGIEFIKEACKDYNLITIQEERFDIENLIKDADLVISLGRGALESMACGKNVIYGDYRTDWMNCFKGGGLITPDNYEDFKIGEWQKERKEMSIENLRDELKKYNPEFGKFNRKKILEDFNIKKTAKQYLDIWTNFKKDI